MDFSLDIIRQRHASYSCKSRILPSNEGTYVLAQNTAGNDFAYFAYVACVAYRILITSFIEKLGIYHESRPKGFIIYLSNSTFRFAPQRRPVL